MLLGLGGKCWVIVENPKKHSIEILHNPMGENCMLTECNESELTSLHSHFTKEIPELLAVLLAESQGGTFSLSGGYTLVICH